MLYCRFYLYPTWTVGLTKLYRTYVHELINPTFHTPILIVCPPVWSRYDRELVTQFVFERLKAPGLCLLDSSLAVCWAYGISSATVIDVGYEKTDITPVLDFIVGDIERDTIPIGGEHMTRHLSKVLGGEEHGWGREMAEQLKLSPICEILDGTKVAIPGQGTEKISNIVKKGKKLAKDLKLTIANEADEDDGAPNVAAIVASGKTREYLEKKEREKQEAAKGAKNLPNWRRDKNKFWLIEKRKPGEFGDVDMVDHWEAMDYEDKTDEHMTDAAPPLEKPDTPPAPSRPGTSSGPAAVSSSRPGTSSGAPGGSSRPGTSSGPAPPAPEGDSTNPAETEEARAKAEAKEKRKEEKRAKNQQEFEAVPLRFNECRREVEVGMERFQAAECGIVTMIADAVYRIIMRVDETGRRQELWDSLVLVGNGCRVRGKLYIFLSFIPPSSPGKHIYKPANPPQASETPS